MPKSAAQNTDHAYSRHARTSTTPAQQLLWQMLRNSQMGVKFKQQQFIGHYIADFYCSALKLVIELDGHNHFIAQTPENAATAAHNMAELGIQIIHLLPQDLNQDLAAVCKNIHQHIIQRQLELKGCV